MILQATDLRKQLFKVFKMIDNGEDITIIKRDSGKKYKIIPVKEDHKDMAKIAKEMGEIGFKSPSIKEMKKIFESRYNG